MKKSDATALLIILIIIAAWELSVAVFTIPAFILPPPSCIFITAFAQYQYIFPHAFITFIEILCGIVIALITALPLAVLMFARPSLEKALSPFLVASQAIPVFAMAPLLVVWFGYGIASKIFMAWIIIFFPICINMLQGLKSCDPELQNLFRLMGASFFKTVTLLYWPGALPHFFAGLKIGVVVATIGAVIGEWVGAQQGLGFIMIQSNARLQVDLVFAAVLWLSIMGIGMWWIVGTLEQKIIKWK